MIQNWLNSLGKKADIDLYTNRIVIKLYQKNDSPLVKEYVATKPFSSNRLLIADFEVALEFFKESFKDIGISNKFGANTFVNLTTKEKNDGGLCALEQRALQELIELSGGMLFQLDDKRLRER